MRRKKRRSLVLRHNPVLLQEVLEHLDLKPGAIVMDGTLGSGGHSEAILEKIGPSGRLIGFDQDPEAIARCRALFQGDLRVTLIHENFRNLEKVFSGLGVAAFDAVLLDIGTSSEQLADGKRGFSFQTEGELDMRMNPEVGLKASELLAQMSEVELADLFYHYGEEHHSRRFARVIVERRREQPIRTIEDLFQALRIGVNDELEALKEGAVAAFNHLKNGGRLGIISFHSIEDRIVKQQFRKWDDEERGNLIFRKPVVANRSEILNNPRARSAKLRVIEKIS
ncbi:MAG: 16S rRNA (cytosine(1402)-N(4))-methyltransferase RsmH [Candidatus Omnitrophica bacterium]|nr:16S rRNA (cytosine(1402)-N(4))-methyltransferase RsmH [Candidatus Omnitrophota bacterium]